MAKITGTDYQNKREFSRVNVHLPVEIRLVPPEQKRQICSRLEEQIFNGAKLPPEVTDPLLAESLNILHAKLDRILGLLAKNQDVYKPPPFRTETLSGGGTSFTCPEEYKLGDLLELKMIFDPFPSGTYYLYGEVVQQEKSEGGYFTAVSFLSLDDGIRDEIIKFVFEKERELLRQKRKA